MAESVEIKPSFGNITRGSASPISHVKLLRKSQYIGAAWCNVGDIVAVTPDNARDWSVLSDNRLFYTRAQKMVEQGYARPHKAMSGEAVTPTSGPPPFREHTTDEDGVKKLWIESATVNTKAGERATTNRQKAGAL